MSNQEILVTLKRHEIRTVGDLDHYADVRRLSRWHALAQLVGEEAADRIIGSLAVRMARLTTAGDHWQTQYQRTGDRGGAIS